MEFIRDRNELLRAVFILIQENLPERFQKLSDQYPSAINMMTKGFEFIRIEDEKNRKSWNFIKKKITTT